MFLMGHNCILRYLRLDRLPENEAVHCHNLLRNTVNWLRKNRLVRGMKRYMLYLL